MPTMERSASVSWREVLAVATAAGLTILPSHALGRGGAGKPAGAPFRFGGLISETSAFGKIGFVQPSEVLIYDSEACLFLNNDEANKALEVSYRQG